MKKSDFKIAVDSRIELLMIAQVLCKYNDIIKTMIGFGDVMLQKETKYLKRIKNYFNPEHNIFRIIEELIPQGFFMGPTVELMLDLTDPPELEQSYKYSEFLIKRANGLENLNRFIDALRDFSLKNNYIDFHLENVDYYNDTIIRLENILDIKSSIDMIESYYGAYTKKYSAIAAPLSQGNYGPKVNNTSYFICGLANINLENYKDKELLKYILWHEFSHSFINPLTEDRYDLINDYLIKHPSIKNNLDSKGYKGPWDECINEHIIRAITVRFAYKNMEPNQASNFLKNEKKSGFSYVPELCRSLEYYEKSREKYRTLDGYYNELLGELGICL